MPTDDVPVDITEIRFEQDTSNPDRQWAGHGLNELPYDLPVNLEVTRHMAPTGEPPVRGLVGWSVKLDVQLRGEVVIKVAKSGSWEVWIDGERVYRGTRKT